MKVPGRTSRKRNKTIKGEMLPATPHHRLRLPPVRGPRGSATSVEVWVMLLSSVIRRPGLSIMLPWPSARIVAGEATRRTPALALMPPHFATHAESRGTTAGSVRMAPDLGAQAPSLLSMADRVISPASIRTTHKAGAAVHHASPHRLCRELRCNSLRHMLQLPWRRIGHHPCQLIRHLLAHCLWLDPELRPALPLRPMSATNVAGRAIVQESALPPRANGSASVVAVRAICLRSAPAVTFAGNRAILHGSALRIRGVLLSQCKVRVRQGWRSKPLRPRRLPRQLFPQMRMSTRAPSLPWQQRRWLCPRWHQHSRTADTTGNPCSVLLTRWHSVRWQEVWLHRSRVHHL